MARSSSAFDRLESALHRQYGDAARLRGSEAVTVVISHNVQLIGDAGEYGEVVSTARFLPSLILGAGDDLHVLGDEGELLETYVLDRPLAGKGNTVEWVLREAL
jgi:hypothetical protein